MNKNRYIYGLFACILAMVLLSWSKLIFTGSIKVDQNPLPGWTGYLVCIVFAIALFLSGRLYYSLYKNAEELSISHGQVKKWGYGMILLSSLMLPLLSNDIFLYLAYGDVSNQGIDVYTGTNVLQYSQWLPYVGNWKDSPYLYGPLSLWMGKIANWVGGNNILGVMIVFKIIQALIAIAFIEILGLMVKHLSDYIWVLFTPVLWLQNIGGMHYDLLAALFLAGSVYFITQQKIVFALALMALATASKMVYIIFLPFVLTHYFMINSERIRLKPILYFIAGLVGFVCLLAISYLPFWKDTTTITIPFAYLNTQEPSKSFSEVIGELLNIGFSNHIPGAVQEQVLSENDGASKIWWWKQCRLFFNVLGMIMAVVVTLVFMIKTKLKCTKTLLVEYYIKISLVFFLFYSHIFNAWYLVALLPFIPFLGNNRRLKRYLLVLGVFSCLHMIFLNVSRDSYLYYLLPPIVFINIALFLWQFRKNFLTVESIHSAE